MIMSGNRPATQPTRHRSCNGAVTDSRPDCWSPEKQEALYLYLVPFLRRAMSVMILSTVETSCTTNIRQIEVMELKGYSWPTCSKQPRLVNCRIGVVNKLACRRRRRRRRVLLTRDRLAVAKFSKSRVWDKVPEGSTLMGSRGRFKEDAIYADF